MHVLLDGRRVEVAAGATIGDLLPGWDTTTVVAVIRPAAKQAAQTGHIRLSTTAGEVVIETAPLFSAVFGDDIDIFNNELFLRWNDRYAAAFGPFPSAILPDRTPHRYGRGDVVLGCAGYDPSRSMLIFSRSDHRADFGAAKDGGVVARVVSGRGVLDRWATGDAITGAERVLSWADRSTSFTTADPATPLEEGAEIVTRVEIAAEGYGEGAVDTTTARSVEHLLLSMEKGTFVIGRAASTFIRDESMIPMEVPAELKRPRREGAVTVRATGGSVGGIYIYREEIPAHPAHTLAGQVVHGFEIVKLADSGQRFSVSVAPPRFDLVGMPLAAAEAVARERGVSLVLEGGGEDLIVVGQKPATTLEALAAGSVTLAVLPAAQVISITLDDENAPNTCDIFRRATGLRTHMVGSMPVLFKFEDVSLFQPSIKKKINILPENTPKDVVPAGSLAMTNESRKGVGMVGVRVTDNSEFGPTSEPFEGTNLIGRVLDLDKLAGLKEGGTVYVREVRKNG